MAERPSTTDEPGKRSDRRSGAPRVEAAVDLRGLTKRFRRNDGSAVSAVDDVSLRVEPGEFIVLLGPSGCGKTTLLRCVAGLEHADGGAMTMGGRTVFDPRKSVNLPPEKRNLGMVFQSYALWPHMTTFKNIAYALHKKGLTKHQMPERVAEVMRLVGVDHLAHQYPGQMSGGQQQRVALARAIAPRNQVVLFDEPLSNVDAKVRAKLRVELIRMQRDLGFAALYVTHDQLEAMEMADKIAVMNHGRIVQLGTPMEVYRHPATRYVAGFIGTVNEFAGIVESTGPDAVVVKTPIGPVRAAPASVEKGATVYTLVRPERCELSLGDPPATANRWRGTVVASMFAGTHVEYVVESAGVTVRTWASDLHVISEGSEVWVSAASDDIQVLHDDDHTLGSEL